MRRQFCKSQINVNKCIYNAAPYGLLYFSASLANRSHSSRHRANVQILFRVTGTRSQFEGNLSKSVCLNYHTKVSLATKTAAARRNIARQGMLTHRLYQIRRRHWMPLQPRAKLSLCLIISGGTIWRNLSSWRRGQVWSSARWPPDVRQSIANWLLHYCRSMSGPGALEAVLHVEEIRRCARVLALLSILSILPSPSQPPIGFLSPFSLQADNCQLLRCRCCCW